MRAAVLAFCAPCAVLHGNHYARVIAMRLQHILREAHICAESVLLCWAIQNMQLCQMCEQ